jgi:hypothetical protein
VIYVPTVREITIDMACLRGPAKAKWFDPTDGSYHDAANGPFTNSGSQQFTPPGKNHAGDGDWILLLQASGANQ